MVLRVVVVLVIRVVLIVCIKYCNVIFYINRPINTVVGGK